MKRPMLLCGFSALITVSLCCLGLTAKVTALILLIFFSALMLFGKARIFFLLPIIVVITIIAITVFRELALASRVSSLKGEQIIYGTVCDVVGYDGAVGYIIDTKRINDSEIGCKVRVISIAGAQLSIGDRVALNVDLYGEAPSTYDLSNGIYCAGLFKGLYAHARGNQNAVYALRQYVYGTVTEKLSYREASVLLGVTLGDKAAIPDEITQVFRRSGISHVIVVSGLHLSILVGGIYTILQNLKIGQRKTGIIGIALTVLLMIFMGLTVSVIRAGLAYIIMFAGMLANRRIDPLNSLFCAVTIILLVNPFAAMSVSFQLSCVATFDVLIVAPYFHDAKDKTERSMIEILFRGVLSAVCITLAATIATLPFTIYHFGTLNLVSILTNVLISLAVSAALLLTVFAAASAFILPFVADMLLLAAGILSKFILMITTNIGKLPFAQITFEQPIIPAFAAAIIALLLASIYVKKYDKLLKKRKERTVQLWRP